MKHFASVVVFAFAVSCNADSNLAELTIIESYIQEDPSTALTELANIHTTGKESPKEKALYSLLYSMALDKNYIDVTSDSLIAPAVNYYSHSKDKVHKFYSYYYQARVFENANDYDKALDAYLKAEQNISDNISPEYKVRLYCGKERLYEKQFATDKALEEVLKAMPLSRSISDPRFYVSNCIDVSTYYHRQNNPQKAKRILEDLRLWLIDRGLEIPAIYYDQDLRNKLFYENASEEQLTDLYNTYISACNNENISPDPILSADVLLKVGDIKKAKDWFEKVTLDINSSVDDSIRYYSTAADLSLKAGEPDKYIYYHTENDRIKESLIISVFNKDIRYMEERFNDRIAREESVRKMVILCIVAGILVIMLVVILVRSVGKRKEYDSAIAELKEEYALYEAVFDYGDDSLPEDVKGLLDNQLSAISPFILKVPNKGISRSELNKIKIDNQEFLRNIGLLYSLSYPKFVRTLAGYGLTAEEIGLCSLYATGFSSKELTSLIKGGNTYRINEYIREKIGDALGGRTLPAWIREQFTSARE